MTHRAETIMATLTTTLAGLTTTGARVYRGRSYPIPAADANALVLFQGEDEVDEDSPYHVINSTLTVNIEAVAREATAQVDATLNKIRREVTMALAADVTLGLAFVSGILEQGAEFPEISDEGDRPEARMRIVWAAQYRRSRTNPAN